MFMEGLEKDVSISWNTDKSTVIKAVRYKKWNVYAKAPFGSPDRVVEYLGRYTHKIAITRHRILEVNATHIRFRYKDYADGPKTKQMWLTHAEFLRRFEQHDLSRVPGSSQKGLSRSGTSGIQDFRAKETGLTGYVLS